LPGPDYIAKDAANLRNRLDPLEKAFQDQIKYSEQEYYDRYLINAMHHPNIDVGGTGRILFPKEVATYFTERKELFPPAFFLLIICVMCFHIGYATDAGSIQLPSLRIISINSSTAFAEGTFRFTTSFPR